MQPTDTAIASPLPQGTGGWATAVPSKLPPAMDLTLVTITMISADSGWATGGIPPWLDRVLRTDDGGHTWSDVTPPTASSDRLLDPQNASILGHFFDERAAVAIRSSSGIVWTTEDGGVAWRSSPTVIASPDYLSFPNRRTGWALAELGHATGGAAPVLLFRTRDTGRSWEEITAGSDGTLLDDCSKTGLAFADDRVGWITRACQGWDSSLSGTPYLDITADGGLAWSQRPLPPPGSEPALFTAPELLTRCGLSSPRLFSPRSGVFGLSCQIEDVRGGSTRTANFTYHTDDAGANWTIYPMPGERLEVIDAQHLWSVALEPADPRAPGSAWRLHVSGNGGASWSLAQTVPWDGHFSFLDNRLVFAVGLPPTRPVEVSLLLRSDSGGTAWETLHPVTGP